VTRFTTDPIAMQVLHLAIALIIWILIFTISPFTIGEKVLLVLSYFLFWEYFVISRNYALMALLGLGFVALRASWPRQLFLPWLLLGLLANPVVLGTIWSMTMAIFLSSPPPFLARFDRRHDVCVSAGDRCCDNDASCRHDALSVGWYRLPCCISISLLHSTRPAVAF